jgi:hypothetical protein
MGIEIKLKGGIRMSYPTFYITCSSSPFFLHLNSMPSTFLLSSIPYHDNSTPLQISIQFRPHMSLYCRFPPCVLHPLLRPYILNLSLLHSRSFFICSLLSPHLSSLLHCRLPSFNHTTPHIPIYSNMS